VVGALPLEQGQLHREVSWLISVISCESTHGSCCVVCARRQWELWNVCTVPIANRRKLFHRFLLSGSG